jgi:hypothetical protein
MKVLLNKNNRLIDKEKWLIKKKFKEIDNLLILLELIKEILLNNSQLKMINLYKKWKIKEFKKIKKKEKL